MSDKPALKEDRGISIWLAGIILIAAMVFGTCAVDTYLPYPETQSTPTNTPIVIRVTATPSPTQQPTSVPALTATPTSVPDTPTPAPTARATATPGPMPTVEKFCGGDFYIVRNGDTLRSIAGAWYGDETLWPLIYDEPLNMNPGDNPDVIHPGLRLWIPLVRCDS